MFEMFHYTFMVHAFIAALALTLATASLGHIIVLRRLSQLGDALSHASLAGVALGMLLGYNPVLGAFIFTVASAFAIELLRRLFPRYAEVSIAVVFSLGIGLAGVLSGYTPAGNFSSFLFGSIVAVGQVELYLVLGVCLLVFVLSNIFAQAYCFLTFDEEAARLAGLPVGLLNILFTCMTALTISVASRTVGALVVSSLLVIPVAAAMQVARNYRQLRWLAALFSLSFGLLGLTLSYHWDLKPGGSIVLLSVLTLLLCFCFRQLRQTWRARRD